MNQRVIEKSFGVAFLVNAVYSLASDSIRHYELLSRLTLAIPEDKYAQIIFSSWATGLPIMLVVALSSLTVGLYLVKGKQLKKLWLSFLCFITIFTGSYGFMLVLVYFGHLVEGNKGQAL